MGCVWYRACPPRRCFPFLAVSVQNRSLCGATSDAARGHKLNKSNEKYQSTGRCILKVFWVQ